MQGSDTSVQTWAEQTAQQSRVSLPQSGTSPGDRREEEATPLPANCSVSRTRLPSSGSNLSDEHCGRPRAPRWGERRRSSHFGSGFCQTVAAYQENSEIKPQAGIFAQRKTSDSIARNKMIKDFTNQTHSQKCVLYKVSFAASTKRSFIPPKFHFSRFINIYLYTYNTLFIISWCWELQGHGFI